MKERNLHLLEAFSIIDSRGLGGVGKNEVLKFLNRYVGGLTFETNDITCLFKRLKLA